MSYVIVHCPSCGEALSVQAKVEQIVKSQTELRISFSGWAAQHKCEPGPQDSR